MRGRFIVFIRWHIAHEAANLWRIPEVGIEAFDNSERILQLRPVLVDPEKNKKEQTTAGSTLIKGLYDLCSFLEHCWDLSELGGCEGSKINYLLGDIGMILAKYGNCIFHDASGVKPAVPIGPDNFWPSQRNMITRECERDWHQLHD